MVRWRAWGVVAGLLLVSFSIPVGAHASGAAITTVSFGGSAANPQITISGSGFGSTAPAPYTTNPAGYTGDDYGDFDATQGVLQFHKNSGFDAGWSDAPPGAHYDYIGLLLSAYQDTLVQFTFGSAYPTWGTLHEGDSFTMHLNGAVCTGTVHYGGTWDCVHGTPYRPAATPEAPSSVLFGAGTALVVLRLGYRRRRKGHTPAA